MLTVTAPDGSKTITGHVGDRERMGAGAVTGVEHVCPRYHSGCGLCASRRGSMDLMIGKTVDTDDDMARVVVMHSRAGSKSVSVYAEMADGTQADLSIRTDR